MTITANNPSVSTTVADPTSVDCSAYAANGTTCIAGQYYHSDNAAPSATWAGTATSTAFGAWTEGNGSSSGCLSCHHGNISTPALGGGYLIGGHKNILRKIVAGQPMLDTQGNQITTAGTSTINFTNGTVTSATGSTIQGYYLVGWYANGSESTYGTGGSYGSCVRCHSTGYRFDANGPEPTSVTLGTPNTYTKLTDAQLGRVPAGGFAGSTSSWYLSGIQCERCHKADMQYDATVVNPNIGTVATPVLTNGRISHFNKIIPTSVSANATTGQIPGTDFYLGVTTGTTVTRPLPNPPNALTCIECHQNMTTWTAKAAGTVGQVHITPLPGFESLAPQTVPSTMTANKGLTGEFSATFACSIKTITTSTPNYYSACITAGGTVTYAPGGMSHGAVATILNSPHARVTGYVDYKNPGTPDTTLTITGGTTTGGITVNGQYNSHFASSGTTPNGATPGGVTNGVTGSCAGCHDIHGDMTTYPGFNPSIKATNVETTALISCTSCHGNHAAAMNHPTGSGTPFAGATTPVVLPGGFGSQESCSICHFTKKTGTEYHFLRINPDPNYNTFPTAATYYTNYGSGNLAPLNTYTSPGETYVDAKGATQNYPAVALDVDMACGQCHVGGNGVTNPYGITPYAGDNLAGSGFVAPRPYSRAFLAAAAVSMHNTNAAAPTFNITLPSTGAPTSIVISSSSISEGSYASIFYTTDGTTPTATVNAAEQYVPGGTTIEAAGPTVTIPVTATTTIYAFAAGPASYSFGPSQIVGGTYGVQTAPKPVISPTNANIVAPATVSVTITKSLSSGTIYYTTNGTTPTASSTPYTGAIVVSTPEVINAVVIASGYANSPVATGTFTGTAAAPAFSLNGGLAKYPGTYTGAVQANLTDAAPSLCYTLDGSTPVATATACTHGTTVASGTNIAITASATIKAVAFGSGYSASKATSGTFVIH